MGAPLLSPPDPPTPRVSEMYQSAEHQAVLRRPLPSVSSAKPLLDGTKRTERYVPDGLQSDLGAGGRGFESRLPDSVKSRGGGPQFSRRWPSSRSPNTDTARTGRWPRRRTEAAGGSIRRSSRCSAGQRRNCSLASTREVLRLVARGGTNQDVARQLGISHRTVQHHVAHIYDKIGVSSRAGAALFAAQNGLSGL